MLFITEFLCMQWYVKSPEWTMISTMKDKFLSGMLISIYKI